MNAKLERRIKDCVIIFILAVSLKLSAALVVIPFSADGSLYMNIARNFAAGRGFTCSDNFYQYWGGHTVFYPALVFMHPLFPFVAGIIWYFFHSLAAVHIFNVLLNGANCLILYLIVERMYTARVALFSTLLVLVSWPMFLTAILPWSEQLHLFFVLAAIWLVTQRSFFQNPACIFSAGVILGLSCLVRVSGFYNLFIFLAVFVMFNGFSRNTVRILLFFWGGFLSLMVPYEIFCFLKYHIFYPEYPACARVFNSSRALGGWYFSSKPVLRLPVDFKPGLTSLFCHNFPLHIWAFSKTVYNSLSFLTCGILARSIVLYQKKRFDENLLFWIGMGHIIMFSLSFFWLPTSRLETVRYSLIPLVCWIPLGVAAFHDFPQILNKKLRLKYLRFGFILIMLPLFMVIGYHSIEFNQLAFNDLQHPNEESIRDQNMYRWVMDHSKPVDLIATSEYQSSFGLDRPIVSLPEGKVINDQNMMDFLNIYHPKYILISRDFEKHYKKYLDVNGVLVNLPASLSSGYVVYKPNIDVKN